jgi:hypothetical protein
MATDTIPHIVHQTWKDGDVPPQLAGFQRSWLSRNPDWQYRFWTDHAARRFVAEHHPGLLPIYDGYAHPIARVDAVRYLWMLHVGGVYADLDFECLRPLAPLLAGHRVVLGLEPASHGLVRTDRGRLPAVCNAFMASTAGHPFWAHVVDQLAASCHQRDPLDATGPRFLTRAVAGYPRPEELTIVDAEVLYPATKEECWAAARAGRAPTVPATAVAVHHWQGTWWRPDALAAASPPSTPAPLPAVPASLADARPRLLIATPVKNALAHVDRYVANLRALRYPRSLISLALLESDSDDGTHEHLDRALAPLRDELRRVVLVKRDFGYRHRGPRWATAIQRTRRSILARSRNHLLQAGLRDEDWVLWLDADVIDYPPDIVETLLATGKHIVVPHCVTRDGRSFDLNTFQYEPGAADRDWSRHVVDGIVQPPRGEGRRYLEQLTEHALVPVDAVGGTMLLVNADLHRDGLVFPSYSHRLHIETEGLAMMAADMGHRCWALPNVRIVHA